MASRSVSPGGALLRASRVFSIPPPLPRPAGEMTANGSYTSDSATLPHPIHMSITTPQSSLLKGDWGLKRPLPLRSTTKSSTPVIRVEKMDTFEHITEFGSAADHTLSLRKWHEMGIPLTTPKLRRQSTMYDYDQGTSNQSVFEDEIDFTAEANDATNPDARWKFKGPWLAGQTQGGFNDYVQKEVRRRKNDFLGFLKETCSKALAKEHLQQRASTDETEELKLPPTAADVTDEQLRDYIKSLRRDTTELYKQIRSFLDLPPSPSPDINETVLRNAFQHMLSRDPIPAERDSDASISMSPYRESGPPKTHPSAGLAYSRTANTLSNHPLFGPQNSKPPVEARIVLPRGAAGGVFEVGLGVGGFVTDTPVGDPAFNTGGASVRTAKQNQQRPLVPGLLSVELEKEGGSKVYVQPKSATIDPKGRVMLKVGSAEEDAVLIKEGKADQIQDKAPPRPSLGPSGASRKLSLAREDGGSKGASQYGMEA